MSEKFVFKCASRSAEESGKVGRALAKILSAGSVVLLFGELAAGKTTLSRELFAEKGYVSGFCSPTFAIINEYKNDKGSIAYHMDLYRIGEADELDYTGFYDCLENGEFCVIEWPEVARGCIVRSCIKVNIEKGETPMVRRFLIETETEEQLRKLKEELNAYSCD